MKLFYRFLSWYDTYWRRKHNVERFDDLLSFSFENFSGDRRTIGNGIWIEPGDCLAIIHFNRECFVHSTNDSKQNTRNALRFRRLILSSFKQLAQDINENEKFSNVKAFHGISWLPPHGEKLGFVIERVPDSIFNSIRKFYFTVLLKTFFPNLAIQSIEPHAYWLTRQTLLTNFSTDKSINEKQINQQQSVSIAGAY
jgi:hypothetical protein